MKPTIYLAGSSSDLTRVRFWAGAIEQNGFELTTRWFDGAEKWAGGDANLTPFQRAHHSAQCFREIRRADFFWLLHSDAKTGADTELGLAHAHFWHWRKAGRVYVSGPNAARSMFTGDLERFEHDVAALAALRIAADESGWSVKTPAPKRPSARAGEP